MPHTTKSATKSAMEISLDAIPAEGVELEFEGDAPTLGLETEEMDLEGPIALTARLDRSGATVAVAGTLSALMRLRCGRCGKELRFRVGSTFRTAFMPLSESPADGEVQLAKDDLDVIFYDGACVPLHRLVREQMILATPMRPLCVSGCQGLCTRCGQDLNVRACSCPPSEFSSGGRRLFDRRPGA